MNLLLVTIDCLRRDRCGIYGHHRDTTPTLDALGREGYVFDNAYATGPVTTESFPGILAGRLSAQTVAGENLYQKCIPEGEPTIATHLRDAGYETVGVISNPRIGSHVGIDRGFETFTNLRVSGESDEDGTRSGSFLPQLQIGERLYQLREKMRKYDSVPYRYELPFLTFRTYQYYTGWPSVRGERIVDEFLDELAESTTPFFGWTHLMDVHGPLHPLTVADGGLSSGSPLSQFRSHAKRVSDVYDAQTEVRYDSSVRYVDGQLRRIVNWLKETNLWDETALIVTADHGEALYDRGIYGHPQHYLYDELLAVPLVGRIPGYGGGKLTSAFSLGWFHEIVADICGIATLDVPLTSAHQSHFESDTTADDVLLADSISHRGHSLVVRQGVWKYVSQNGELANVTETRVGPQGHFRLDKNPKERQAHDDSWDVLERVADELIVVPEELRKQTRDSSIDNATRDQLKQLGYTEG